MKEMFWIGHGAKYNNIWGPAAFEYHKAMLSAILDTIEPSSACIARDGGVCSIIPGCGKRVLVLEVEQSIVVTSVYTFQVWHCYIQGENQESVTGWSYLLCCHHAPLLV